jgi:hypothetical protein
MLGVKADPKDKLKQIAKSLGMRYSERVDIIEGKTK